MTPEVAVDLFREALWLTTTMVAILVVPSLIVGLLVSMFQAATQINEQTLSFLPRLLVMLITLIVVGPWLVRTFMEYIISLYTSIPQVIG
ncbi:flagellar biosynthesis protein FliQ [Pseudomonas putida]|jgi:flagellar biosynthetic protein FliQ|uniref:flagellar biosynthesis protein FliQ n=1 Tax=Pseudomonas TaxID=286 RepID=UPI002363E994|nr:flagellar biosynthesis protein FliQ [Pseudomonas putida]MDD1965710.1 flagellar biosynthesis protein FliQ [Pseudomonas putida]